MKRKSENSKSGKKSLGGGRNGTDRSANSDNKSALGRLYFLGYFVSLCMGSLATALALTRP